MKDTVLLMTYEDWEKEHNRIQRQVQQRHKKYIQKLRRYYLMQKLYGALIILFGLIVSVIGCLMNFPDLTGIGAICILIGLYVMISRELLLQ